MFATRTLAALILGCAIVAGPGGSRRRDERPPRPHARLPAPPSPAAIAAADQLLIDMGVKESIAKTVPSMMAELETNVTTTHPEIRDSLRQTLTAIKPEFDKSAQLTYEKVEALLALALNEKEIVEVAAFFTSPTGKKYLAIAADVLPAASGACSGPGGRRFPPTS